MIRIDEELGEIQGILHPSRSHSKREIDIPGSVQWMFRSMPAYRPCVPLAERTVFNGRTRVRRPLTDAAVNNRHAHESHAVTTAPLCGRTR